MFKMKFKTSNAAFNEPDKETEVRRILEKISEEIEYGKTSGSIMDINGNRVGEWEMV